VFGGTVGATTGTYATITTVYTSVTRSRYANVVNNANQILGAEYRAYVHERKYCVTRVFFLCHRNGCLTNGGRLLGMHTATTVVSADPSALNNTVGFCIDAGDLGAISF
jgi:hypothetical protein